MKRFGTSYDEARTQLFSTLHAFAIMSREERTKNKLEARRVASMVDWEMLVENYFEAHDFAMKKALSR